jgi:inosine/xanthosine triphosphatase
MKTIALASANPVKVQATLNGFRRMFPDEKFQMKAVSTSSGVKSQPLSDAETLQGALNRARNAAQLAPGADYWVGIEGGVEETDGEMSSFSWVVVCSRKLVGKGRTGTFFLPPQVADLIRQGRELGQADDIVFNRSNSKQDNGAVGLLTGNVIDRAQLYEQAVILALAPFKNTELYSRP